MYLIVGLGNPGKRYAATRHNLGFEVINTLAQKFHVSGFDTIETAEYCMVNHVRKELVLAKPTTYMNDSGRAVLDLVKKFAVTTKEVIVVSDDINLPLGIIRVRQQGSDGGHKGLASVIYHLTTHHLPRIRLGIGRGDESRDVEEHVLKRFAQDEVKIAGSMISTASEAALALVENGIDSTMNRFNAQM